LDTSRLANDYDHFGKLGNLIYNQHLQRSIDTIIKHKHHFRLIIFTKPSQRVIDTKLIEFSHSNNKAIIFNDESGYKKLKKILVANEIKDIFLGGYALDQCVKETTGGYLYLSQDFHVTLMADFCLSTFNAQTSPKDSTTQEILKVSRKIPISTFKFIK